MDNADRIESHPEVELSDDLKMESSHESPKIKNDLVRESEDFLKMEGQIESENIAVNENITQDPLPVSELGSVSSSNLITNESVVSPSNVLTEEHSEIETTKSVHDKNPSDEVNDSTEPSDDAIEPNDTLSKGDNAEKKDEVTSNVDENESDDEVKRPIDFANLDEATAKKLHIVKCSRPINLKSYGLKEPKIEWLDILGTGHILKKLLKPGIPNSRPQKSDICVLNLVGRLADETVVEQFENLEITLSDNEVVQGLDLALALVDKGEESIILVTSRFAYGIEGRSPDIPPGATIYYSVTLLDVKEQPLINTLDVSERITCGLKKKERGNWWFSRDENTLAINCYRRALEYFDDTEIPEPHSEEDVRKLLEERLKTYNNLGAAQYRIAAYDAALMSVNNVLTAQPNNLKALFRKARVLRAKGELQDGINVIKKALSFAPESQIIKQELSIMLAAQQKVFSSQRELYKKMMGNSNKSDEEDNKESSSSKNNYKTFTIVAVVSFTVAVLGTIVLKYKF